VSSLDDFRRAKDTWFRQSAESPIPPGEREAFNGLSYFPERPDLRLAVRPERYEAPESILMQTTAGDVQEYQRWGRFSFEVDGQPAALTIYYAPWGEYFVPFADATSGGESYGAGRYMALEPLGDGQFLADFNLAYNPYCAYDEAYSCPIPPAENRLAVPILAGERTYH
jgi:uncharacterized protein (DUF1684 family)